MAYGKRLYMEFTDELQTVWTVEIWDNLFAGVAVELEAMGDPPVVIRYNGDKEKVIIGSEATVTIVGTDTSDFSWIDLSTGDDIKVLIKKAGTLYWSGYGLPGQYVDELKDVKRFLTITASDHLGQLDKIYYQTFDSPPEKYSGYALAIVQIARALNHTNLNLSITSCCNLFETTMTTADLDDPFNQFLVNQDIWLDADRNSKFCADVLEGILAPFDCRVFQSGGNWVIQRKSDMAQSSVDYRTFTYLGVSSGQGSFDFGKPTQLTPTRFCLMADHSLEYLEGWKERLVKIDYGLIPSVWFEDGIVDKDDPTAITGWTNPGAWSWTQYQEFGVVSKRTVATFAADVTKYIQSPEYAVKDDFDHLIKLNCGKTQDSLIKPIIRLFVIFTDGSSNKYHWNEADQEWTAGLPASPYKDITSINFPDVSGPASLTTQELTVKQTPADGTISVFILNPFRGVGSLVNSTFYFSGFAIQRIGKNPDTEEEDGIIGGGSYLVTITDEEYYKPSDVTYVISDGLTDKTQADYYNGWMKLVDGTYTALWTAKYAPGDGLPLVISGINSTDGGEGHLIQAWYEQYSSAVKKFVATIHGHADYFNTVVLTELDDTRFIWGDVEYNIKMVEWSGTLYELKATGSEGTKTTGYKIKTLLWVDKDKRDFTAGDTVILSGKENYLTKWESDTELTYSFVEEVLTEENIGGTDYSHGNLGMDPGWNREIYVKDTNLDRDGVADTGGGYRLTIHAGNTGNASQNGGDLYLNPGAKGSGGTDGNIIMGWNGLAGYGKVGVRTIDPKSCLETGGSFGGEIYSYTDDYTLGLTDLFVKGDGTTKAVTFTLPAASTCFRRLYILKAIDITHTVKVVSTAGDIDDYGYLTGYTFEHKNQVIGVWSDASKWSIAFSFNDTFRFPDMAAGSILAAMVENEPEDIASTTGLTVLCNDTGEITWETEPFLEDISFEFCDITPGTAQTYILDIYAQHSYEIIGAILQSDDTMDNVAIKIGSTAVTSLSAIDVTTAVSVTVATGANTVVRGNQVTLVTSGTDGDPTLIRGKLYCRKILQTT